jgi:hypothetical protein
VAPHVTIGGEAGGVNTSGGGGAIVSANVGAHFRRRVEAGLDPFISGGVTGVRVGGETGLYANIGGGLNYWLSPGVGVRGEFRGYPGGRDLNTFSEFRFGLSFRLR